jgi:hypothetical protein
MLDRNALMPPRGEPERRTNRLKALLQRQIPGAAEESLLGRASAAMALVAVRTTSPSANAGGLFLKQ